MRQIGTKRIRQQALRSTGRQEGPEEGGPEQIAKQYVISHSTDDAINLYSFVQGGFDPAKKGGVLWPILLIC